MARPAKIGAVSDTDRRHDTAAARDEHRIVLVKTDDDLRRARIATARLVTEMAHAATWHRFIGVLNDFFLNEALFRLRPIYPFA